MSRRAARVGEYCLLESPVAGGDISPAVKPKPILVRPDCLRRLLLTELPPSQPEVGGLTVPVVGYYASKPLREGDELLLDYQWLAGCSPVDQNSPTLSGFFHAYKAVPQPGGAAAHEMLREVVTQRRVAAIWFQNSMHAVMNGVEETTERLVTEDDGLSPAESLLGAHPLPQDGTWDDSEDDEDDEEGTAEWYRKSIAYWPAYPLFYHVRANKEAELLSEEEAREAAGPCRNGSRDPYHWERLR